MERVIADGITFIPIDNLKNSLCYHVAVVHLLHTSKTLNELLIDVHEEKINGGGVPTELFRILLMPNIIYAQTNESNYKEKYTEIKAAYDVMYSQVMAEYAKHGYSSFYLLYFYYLPLLYRRFPEHFVKICEELTIDDTFFKTPFVTYADVLENRPFLKKEYTSLFKTLNEELQSMDLHIERKPLKGAILEIYPNADSAEGGHAIFLLRTKKISYEYTDEKQTDDAYIYESVSSSMSTPQNVYYIFDDATTIDLFQRYLENRNGFVAKICIHTTDADAIKELQSLWGKNVLSKRVNNRYELLADTPAKKDDAALIASSFVQVSKNNEKMKSSASIAGGSNQKLLCNRNRYLKGGENMLAAEAQQAYSPQPMNIWKVATFILITVLIIDIIFGLTHGCYKQRFGTSIKCPCNKK